MKKIYYPKITCLFLLVFLPYLLYSQGWTTQAKNAGHVNWTVKNPFEHKVFIENAGQFDNAVAGAEKVLYYAKTGGVKAYFTATGLYYTTTDPMPSGKDDEHPEEWKNDAPVIHTVSMHWQNAETSSYLKGSDEASAYFTYDRPNGGTIKANAFNKIIYKNIYPHIDVEYTIPEKGGIEYSLLLHPGADISNVKMDYSDKNSLLIGEDGSISHPLLSAGGKDLTEYAPKAYYASNPSNTISSSFRKQDGMVTFQLGKHAANTEIVIDPWIVIPGFTVANDVFDIGKDLAGNIYAQGGGANNAGGSWEVEKYNSLGTLQWTFTTPWNSWKGGFAADGTGCTYVADGCCTGGIRKLSPSGVVLLNLTTGFTEYWMMSFDCSITNLYMGIGLHTGSIALMDTATGAMTNTTLVTGNTETRAMGWAPNNNIYFITEGTDQLVAVNSAFANLFTVASGYVWGYQPNPNYVTGLSPVTGQNAIAGGLSFLATSDGAVLKKWNLNNGALISSVNLPGGSAENYSGITVDYCGNIFVGAQDSVLQYDSALTRVSSLHVSNSVYCVILGNNSDVITGGMNFLADLNFTAASTPSVTIAVTNAGCSNCNATATATLDLCGVKDTTTVTYLWSNAQTTRTATGLCAGSYTVSISGCFQTSYVDSVTITAGLVTTTSSTPTACTINNGSATITAAGMPPYTYSWSTGATTSSISGLSAGTYTCTVTDSTGCSATASINVINPGGSPVVIVTPSIDSICNGAVGDTLKASGAITYTWLPTAGLSCTTCANPVASPAVTTTYTVTGDSLGCTGTATATVTVLPPPTITATASPDTVCSGSPTTLTGHGGTTYSWAPSAGMSCPTCTITTATPNTLTTYTVTGTDAHGCTSTGTVTVNVAAAPNLVATGGRSICPGENVTLTATGSGTNFNWQPGNSSSPSITVTPTVTTTYTVTLSDGCGIATANVTITVNPMPVPNISADVLAGCSPFCVQFRNTSTITSGNISQYSWIFGNGDTSDVRAPAYCYPKPGDYSVTMTATSDSGCSATYKVYNMITVYSHPNASFTFSPQATTILQPTIQFTDNSTDAYGIAYWIWNFGVSGNDTLSSLKNPSYSYWDTGTFCPSEVVMNIHGCVDTVTNCLVIDPAFTCYIPDAFTPNGDGKNETFRVIGNDIKTFEMYIFDRWGQQLFHTNDINDGWDGSAKAGGTVQQEDTYVYLITIYDTNNQKHSYLGKVSLIK